MALNSTHLDDHIRRTFGPSGYTISGANATFTGSLNEQQLRTLVEVAGQTGYKATVVSGVLTLSPR